MPSASGIILHKGYSCAVVVFIHVYFS